MRGGGRGRERPGRPAPPRPGRASARSGDQAFLPLIRGDDSGKRLGRPQPVWDPEQEPSQGRP